MEGKNEIQTVFCYKGADITFQNNDGSIMVNATEMAKQFGKRTVDWTRQKSSENFMRKLGEVRNLTSADMIRVVHGDGGCTWMHEDVALEFARWLSPEFAIWCNDRIKELLKFGITATQTTIENIIADPESGIRMLQALKSEREMRKRLEAEKQQQQLQINQQNQQILALSSEIESMQPKVSYYDKILANKSTVLVTSIALVLSVTFEHISSPKISTSHTSVVCRILTN